MQPQTTTECSNVGKKKCAWVTDKEVCAEVPDEQCLQRKREAERERRRPKCKSGKS